MTVKYLFDVHVQVAIASGLWQKLPDLQIAEARLLFPELEDLNYSSGQRNKVIFC